MSKRVIDNPTESQFSLWDLPIVGEGDAPTVVKNAEKMLPTAEDIEEIQQQAYKEAYDEAFAKAQAEGLAAGREEGQKQGYEQGKAEGYEHGIREGQEVIGEKTRQLSAIISTLVTPLEKVDQSVEDELVYLAMSTARHLVRREIKTDPTHVIAAVRQAVELLPIATQNIKVLLHPEDANLVREYLSVNDDEDQRWKIVEDPMISRGGCNVETEHSRIDASVETRINSVIAQVLGDERESLNDFEPGKQSK